MRLSSFAARAGFRVTVLDEAGSTNDEAMRAAKAGDSGKLWILAHRQKAGRGRHGRVWESLPGNLFASLLLVDPCDVAKAHEFGFIAGLALHDGAGTLTGLAPPRLALKWPNDLLLDRAKVAGILLEGQWVELDSRHFALVIGFGINLAAAPEQALYPVAKLNDVATIAIDTVFEALSTAMAARLQDWERNGFSALRADWLARAAGTGEPVTLRLPGREKSGSFAGIDEAGRLRLKTKAGTETFETGDLFFGHDMWGDLARREAALRN